MAATLCLPSRPRDTSPNSLSAVSLHMRAMNEVGKSMRELRHERTNYEKAKRALTAALSTLNALSALDASTEQEGGAA